VIHTDQVLGQRKDHLTGTGGGALPGHQTGPKPDRFLCKRCPDEIFVSAELIEHVQQFREKPGTP